MTTDQSILFWIQNNLVNPVLNPYMIILSTLGNVGAVWIFSGIVLLSVKRYRRAGVAVILALFMSLIFGNVILKPLIARIRPCIIYPWIPLYISMPLPTDYSFPSGHTFGSFAAATAIFCRSKRVGTLALLLAAGIGFSRMYLFVHYPSDILAGVLLGTLSGIIAYKISYYLPTVYLCQKKLHCAHVIAFGKHNGIRKNNATPE